MKASPAAQRLRSLNSELKRISEKRETLINNHAIPKLPKNDYKKFNEIIGLPRHPSTLKPSPILDFQFHIHDRIKKRRRTITNKSRKIGSSDTHLRSIAESCFDDLIGHGCAIIFGNRQPQANEFIDDFDALFHNGLHDLDGKFWSYGDIISKKKSSRIELYSDTYLQAYPADSGALRGPKNIRWVLYSEAAHVKRLDDSKIYVAMRPLVANDPLAYFTMESTPNGKRGVFYDESVKAMEHKNEYDYYKYPYTVAYGTLLSKEFIESERNNPKINFAQEYEAEFTSSNSAVFREDEINKNYIETKITNYDEILGHV